MRQINGQLKDLLQASGIKQYFLADLLGITEVRLSRLVHHRAVPTEKEKKKISQFFGIAKEQLFRDSGLREEPIELQ